MDSAKYPPPQMALLPYKKIYYLVAKMPILSFSVHLINHYFSL
ncbi:hypothetical protein MARINOS108_140080 [Marinoscillum sp. 108]|nr:hypothetical protein MARINOS108_140080 [Marinoscillum sp. 108]